MTALRKRFIEDLQLHGFAPTTQQVYVNAIKQLPGIGGFSLILRRVILARKASVVSEYKLTIAASVPLEIAATLEASLLSKHVALFRRGKRSEHGLAVVAKSRLSSHGIAPKSVMVKKRQSSVWQCGSVAVAK